MMGTKELEETGAEVYTFARPVNFEGDTFESLSIDFDKLTGEDILTCDRQYQMESARQSGGELIKETNKAYQAYIVARAAGVHVGLIKALPAKDFTKLTLQAQSFLLL
ncbi:phage tail assembly protein [Paenibacillus sp. FSL R7-277]|nr:phage tail assembly protein [Paenibacillus sp. FSL R7-277]